MEQRKVAAEFRDNQHFTIKKIQDRIEEGALFKGQSSLKARTRQVDAIVQVAEYETLQVKASRVSTPQIGAIEGDEVSAL